jgi:iron complex outermembrane recepter protein
MKTIATRAAPLLALATFLATPASAEDADSTIIVTAQTATDAAEERAARTPGGTDVVAYEDYADKSVVSLRDTLAFSPG